MLKLYDFDVLLEIQCCVDFWGCYTNTNVRLFLTVISIHQSDVDRFSVISPSLRNKIRFSYVLDWNQLLFNSTNQKVYQAKCQVKSISVFHVSVH